MWLRPRHKVYFSIGSAWLLSVLSFLLFSACSPSERQEVDKLNSLSYACHYRSVDSTEYYARKAFAAATSNGGKDGEGGGTWFGSQEYLDGKAEAYNNLAFAHIIQMRYSEAQEALDAIPSITDNQLELLVCYVQQMRLCQRRSLNREFYDYRERAVEALKRINEEREMLDERQRRRLLYAESELAIVSSTYYYYIGLEQQSIEALNQMPEEVKQDTAQFLNYLYNVGAGGIITAGTQQEINQQEFDYLVRCLQIADRDNYPYFAANALEALAEHLTDPESRSQLIEANGPGMKFINPKGVDEEELPVWLAEEALYIFQDYGDVYQIAGAYRTLASCYRARGDYEAALENLELSLQDKSIFQAPDLVASIREQLSVAYAAIDDKATSDYNRNLYLDLQEQTRQDRQLEARADQLNQAVSQLNWMLGAVALAIVLLLALLWLFRSLNRHQRFESQLDEELEERSEQLAICRRNVVEGERRHLEQRARISLVNSLLPLIDRMMHEVKKDGDKDYIRELTEQIETDNELLTEWIQLRQGQVTLRIESFPLQPLFDMVARSRRSFQMKGISLTVEPTETVVKADRILTLFMLNTLADNARKFTENGEVTISAAEGKDYVEISVKDTGIGMDEESLSHVFDRKVITDDSKAFSKDAGAKSSDSHGFGLLNCKGIIEKYRKLSSLFSVCCLQAESQEGRGSRFYFRLPKGVVRILAFGLWLLAAGLPETAYCQSIASEDSPLARAAVYADSAYFSNINGTYERTLLFADSCRKCLNEHYRRQYPKGTVLLLADGDMSVTPPEILWLHDSVMTNYSVILDIRNESAVAALALHEWQLYSYNNRIYTSLFKELSADDTLAGYCRTMQQTRTNRMIAVVLLVLALLSVLPLYYFYYLRPRLSARFKAENQRREELEMMDDDLRKTEMERANLHISNAVLDNCLSTLKHETMYYPSRIRQLLEQDDMEPVSEVVSYYRELYNMLSLQAMSQVERVKLHLQHLDHGILGDATLVGYLSDLLQKQQPIEMQYAQQGTQYVRLECLLPEDAFRDDRVSQIDYLLIRQIARDHGEATNRRACSVRKERREDGRILMTIILPAYGKVQSYSS